jgi:uncharacterized protein YndB with AHSA1/START domain
MDDADLGTLEQRGDRWTVALTRRFPHPPEKVWRAITEPEHMAAWFPDQMIGERKAGAALRFVNQLGDGFDGEMLVFEPPSVMELAWGTDHLRMELQPDGDGTLFTLTDTFAELGKAARDAAGWHECVVRLVSHLEGSAAPATGQVWRDVHPLYVERFGPEAATIGPPEGWEELTEQS